VNNLLRKTALVLCVAIAVSTCSTRTFAQEKILKGEVISSPPAEQIYRPIAPMPKGPKKMIAVADFENKTNWQGQWSLGSGMSEQLITALMDTGGFIVLEREEIQGVLAEQDFGQSGRTTAEGGAQLGKIQRAQILVKGAVTEFATNTSDNMGGLNIEGFNIGGASSEAKVTVDIRIYDTTTSQVLDSQSCTGIAKSSGLAISYTDKDWGVGGSNFKKTPLGQATRQAIDQAVRFITLRMENVRWQGKVVLVKDNVIYINHGSQSNIMLRDKFDVFKPGEALIDPDTGMNLGSEEAQIGQIEIVEVQDKYSKAAVISGSGFSKGDFIRYQW
jgi:curli biogenesis system outer membrane secretion channel CsgG